MNFLSIEKKLRELQVEIFTLNDLVKITNQKKEIVKSKLTLLVKQQKIYRLKKNYYSLKKIEHKFQLQKLFEETYLGLHSALEFYESTTQRYNNLDIVTKKVLNNQEVQNTNITFHKIKEKNFFGFEKKIVNNTEIFVSSIEKTIIDCIYFSSKIYLTDIVDFIKKYKQKIDVQKLENFLKKINSSTLNKRAGYLLELQGIELKHLNINNKYEKLNSNKAKKGTKNKKWKLLINEEILKDTSNY